MSKAKSKNKTAAKSALKPLLSSERNVVYNLDCMEGLKQYPDNHFDLAIVDPPYGIGAHNGISPGSVGVKVDTRNGYKSNLIKRTNYPEKEWDNTKPSEEYFSQLFRVSKNQIVWGMNHFDLPETTCVVVWDKANVGTYQSDCEIAWGSFNTTIRKVTYMWSGGWQGKSIKEGHIMQGNKSKNEKRIHPTQKPVKLYEWLLTNYANEGDKILDTHVGSGSSRIACHKMGFHFTGFEIDKDYWLAQEERYNNFKRQLTLF